MAKIDKIPSKTTSDDLKKSEDEIAPEDMISYFTEDDLDDLENDNDMDREDKESEEGEKVLSSEDIEELKEGSLEGWGVDYEVLHEDTSRVINNPEATPKDKDLAKESEDIALKEINRLHDEMNRIRRKFEKEGKNYKEEKEYIKAKQKWTDAKDERLEKMKNGKQEDILKDLGLDLSAEDIEKEIQHELDGDMIKIKKESRKEIEKFLKNLKIEFSEDEQNRIIENVENTLSEAIDEEAAREFSKLGYHGKVIAAGVGVGAVAAGITMAMKMTGAGMISKIATAVSGTVVGASGGALRAFVKKKLNPQIEKLKEKNKTKFNEIREKKMKEIINSDLIKTLFIQEIRRSSVIKVGGGEEVTDGEYLKNIREFLKVFQATKGLSGEERGNLSKAISVLNTINKKNEKEAVREIKKMNKILKGASIGAVFGAIADAGRYFKFGGDTILISGALGGAMMGGTIDAFLEKHFDKKHEKEILDSIEGIMEKIDKKEEKSPDELAQLKAVVQSKKLEKYPHILEQARHILSTELLKSVSQKTDEMFSGELAFVDEEKVLDKERKIQEKFDSKKGKMVRKTVAYSLGIAAGMATGLIGREVMAYFRGEGGGGGVNSNNTVGVKFDKITAEGPVANKEGYHKIPDDVFYKSKDIPDPLTQYEKEVGATSYKESGDDFSHLYSQKNADYIKAHPDVDSVQADDNTKYFSFEKEDTSHDIAAFQEIKGNVDTYSEAAYEAVKKAPTGVQDNFIHRYLDNDVKISNANREKLLIKTVHLLSVANLDNDSGNDVQNLVYEKNVGVLKNNGEFGIMKGDAFREARSVSHDQLQATADKIHRHFDHADRVLSGGNDSDNTYYGDTSKDHPELNTPSEEYIQEQVLNDVSNAGLNVEDYGAIKDMPTKEFLNMSSNEIAHKISDFRAEHDGYISSNDEFYDTLNRPNHGPYKADFDAVRKLQEELRSVSGAGGDEKSVGDVLREKVVGENIKDRVSQSPYKSEEQYDRAVLGGPRNKANHEFVHNIIEKNPRFSNLDEHLLNEIHDNFQVFKGENDKISFNLVKMINHSSLKPEKIADNLGVYLEDITSHKISQDNLEHLKNICHDLKFGLISEKEKNVDYLVEYIKLAEKGELAGSQVQGNRWHQQTNEDLGGPLYKLQK